jgi:hypothetical protein
MCKIARRFMGGLKQSRKLSRLQKPCQTLYPICMKTLCAFAFCLVFAAAEGVAKQRHCTFRLHAQANPRDTEVFATSIRAQVSGKTVAIEKTPWISEQDVMAFSPYPAANGTYGALFQLDEHGRVVLDTLSVERRGSLLFVFINGRPITELEIDKRVSDGKIYIPSGLTSADIELMKKDWRMIGQRKR